MSEIKTQERYTCQCGSNLLVSGKKQHEKTPKHIQHVQATQIMGALREPLPAPSCQVLSDKSDKSDKEEKKKDSLVEDDEFDELVQPVPTGDKIFDAIKELEFKMTVGFRELMLCAQSPGDVDEYDE